MLSDTRVISVVKHFKMATLCHDISSSHDTIIYKTWVFVEDKTFL
jgi:hypothetical protein